MTRNLNSQQLITVNNTAGSLQPQTIDESSASALRFMGGAAAAEGGRGAAGGGRGAAFRCPFQGAAEFVGLGAG